MTTIKCKRLTSHKIKYKFLSFQKLGKDSARFNFVYFNLHDLHIGLLCNFN